MTIVRNNGQSDGHNRDANGRILTHSKNEPIYLLAYPRSGSNWFRYCFEFITKRTAHSRRAEWPTGASNPMLLFHTHDPNDHGLYAAANLIEPDLGGAAELSADYDPARPIKNILLVRNYNEAIASQLYNYRAELASTIAVGKQSFGLTPDKPVPFENQAPLNPSEIAGHDHGPMHKEPSELISYIRLIETHDKFSKRDQKTSLLVYYEDFITDPRPVLTKVIDYLEKNFPEGSSIRMHDSACSSTYEIFGKHTCATSDSLALLGFPTYSAECYDKIIIPSPKDMKNNLDKLLENLDHHKNTCLRAYKAESGLGLSTTEKSSNLSFYSSLVSKEFLLEMDKCIKEYSELFNKYLSHYEGA